jgi:hypothetical protein
MRQRNFFMLLITIVFIIVQPASNGVIYFYLFLASANTCEMTAIDTFNTVFSSNG